MTAPLHTLSFVIPAYNEAEHISRTVTSVFDVVPPAHLAQVIVCDHGSTDETGLLARAAGAEVHTWFDGTIAAQRNRGAALATGDVLVFLDADTSLDPAWAEALPQVLAQMTKTPMLVTGSHPSPPAAGSWLERHWFANLAEEDNARHLGSAHLLIARAFFEEIGGFDETLETGEDFELCVRSTDRGGAVRANTALQATHHDFPKNLWAFARREAWHGRGNFASLEMAMRSPVSLATVGFTALHVLAYRRLRRGRVPVLPVLGIAALCAASSQHKFAHAPLPTRAINTGVFYFYYVGRSWSLVRTARSVDGAAGVVLRGVGAFMT